MFSHDQLHPDARSRFDELSRALVSAVIEYREPAKPPSQEFEPNIQKGPTVTDADVIGDIYMTLRGPDGRPIGLVIPQIGGTRKGLVGTGFKQLQALARAMAKVPPFKDLASVEFIEKEIFEWIKSAWAGPADVGCVDFVMSALDTAAIPLRVIVPVSELYVQSPLALGSVVIRTFPEAFIELFEKAKMPEAVRMRADFQGLAAAETEVRAEPIRAREIAVEKIDLVIGIIRFFAPAHIDGRMVSRIDRWGYSPERLSTLFLATSAEKFSSFDSSMIDPPGKMVIDDKARATLEAAGLAELRSILDRSGRTDMEESLLAGMVTFGRAALTPELNERLIWYCAGLESVLLRNSSEPILQNLAERLAIFTYSSVDDRLKAIAEVRAAYSLRSDFVHHGAETDEGAVVQRFAHHGLKFFLKVIKRASEFKTQEGLIEAIERMKFSGA